MKKLITILVASIFVVSSLFAEVLPAGTPSVAGDSVGVSLLGIVNESTYFAQLRYDGTSVFDGDILNESARFDLTTSNASENFTIYFTSNYVSAQNIEVTVTSTDFTRDSDQAVISDVSQATSLSTTVADFPADNLIAIPNGFITNYLAETFHIAWNPNTNLASGNYTSTITVAYASI